MLKSQIYKSSPWGRYNNVTDSDLPTALDRAKENLAPLRKAGIDPHLFPIAPNSKVPLPGSNGFKNAEADDFAQDDLFASAALNCNVGLSPGPSRFFIVDVDPKNGGDETLAKLQAEGILSTDPTFMVKTPSGGRHLYFRLPDGVPLVASSVGREGRGLGPGVDVRCDGGYVVAPGSIIDGKTYTVIETCPPAMASKALIGACRRVTERHPNADKRLVELDLPENVNATRRWLAETEPAIADGTGNEHTYETACMVRDRGISEEMCSELMLEPSWNDRCLPPWEKWELEIVVGNAYRYAKRPAGTEAFSRKAAALQPAKEQEPKAEAADKNTDGLLPVLYGDALWNQKMVEWLIQDVMQKGAFTIMWGDYGALKTFSMIYLLCNWAHGMDVLGRKSHHVRRVLIIAAESKKGTTARVKAWAMRNGIAPADLQVDVLDMTPQLLDDETFQKLRKTILAREYGAIGIDTMSQVIAGKKENDQADMTLLVDRLQTLCALSTEPAILLIHHSNKAGTSSRGSNVPAAAAAGEILVTKVGPLTARLEFKKQREGEILSEHYLRGEFQHLDTLNEAGFPHKTLVFDYNPNAKSAALSKDGPLTKEDRWYLGVVRAVERVSMQMRKHDPEAPENEAWLPHLVACLKGQMGYSSSSLYEKLPVGMDRAIAGNRIIVSQLDMLGTAAAQRHVRVECAEAAGPDDPNADIPLTPSEGGE